jgi:hypothetical protein
MTTSNGYNARLNEHDRRLGVLEPAVQDMMGDIREIRTSNAQMATDIHEIRQQAARREDMDRTTLRWRVTMTLSVIGAILVAAGIVANQL